MGYRWGATPLQDAYLGGDQVMCALLERAGGKMADDPAIKDKLPAQMVCCAVVPVSDTSLPRLHILSCTTLLF